MATTTTSSPDQAAAEARAIELLRPYADASTAIGAIIDTLENPSDTGSDDDGDVDALAKAMLKITRTRSEVRKNADASPALAETVEKAHDTAAKEYLAQHSGAYAVWEEAARKAGRLPEHSAG